MQIMSSKGFSLQQQSVSVPSMFWHVDHLCSTCLVLCTSFWTGLKSVWFLSAGVSSPRTTVGFVERRHKDVIKDRVGPQPDTEAVKPGETERGGAKTLSGAETAAARLRAQRSLSPEGHRSSSLPPPAYRNIPAPTPSMCCSQALHTHHPTSSVMHTVQCFLVPLCPDGTF